LESTIVDVRGKYPIILRQGIVTEESMARVLKVKISHAGRTAPPTPGMKHRHYAPTCHVILVTTQDVRLGHIVGLHDKTAGLICRSDYHGKKPRFYRRITGGQKSYAQHLFSSFRDAEAAAIRTLYVETVPEKNIGRAVMDRLRRAARR
jgi:L-threonylcarbamoyladenylate synthase